MTHCTIYACIDSLYLYCIVLILVLVSINGVHTHLLSCRKSKLLTSRVITGHYNMALCSVFGQTIEVIPVDILSPFLYCELLMLSTCIKATMHSIRYFNQ